MRLVVDTSVLVAVVANEPTKAELIEITRGASLFAPSSVHWEIGNAFAAMLKRGRVKIGQVRRALAAYGEIPIRYLDVDLMDAMNLAAELKIYAYDAYVLACAQAQHAPLVTLDRGLVRAAEQVDVDVIEVSS